MSETRGPEFRWMESGDGECVLFLHGLMGEMDHWEPSLETLAHVCRPMALALPVFDPALGEASIAELGRHVVRFLDAIEISRAVVGGNSLGGHVALEVALSHPDRVAGLILTGSSGLFERGFTRNVPHCPTAEYVRQKMEEVVYDPGLVTQAWVEAVRKVVTTRATALRVLRFAQAAKRHNIESRLPEIRVPTLIVWGKDDRITPPDIAERFHALIPESQLWLLSHCGHAPMLEQPQAFNAIVREWLNETWLRRAQVTLVEGAVR